MEASSVMSPLLETSDVRCSDFRIASVAEPRKTDTFSLDEEATLVGIFFEANPLIF